MHACIHACMDVWLHACMNIWLHACMHACMQVLELPSEVHFADYSAVAVRGNLIVITSQEDSRLWLGRLNTEEQPQTKTEKDSSKAPPTIIKDPMQLQVLPGKSMHACMLGLCCLHACDIDRIEQDRTPFFL